MISRKSFSVFADSCFLLANARIVDFPIVFGNEGFSKLSGYSRAEVMQKSSMCTFMYGEQTNREVVSKLDGAMENHEQEQVEILLYKKNSTLLGWLMGGVVFAKSRLFSIPGSKLARSQDRDWHKRNRHTVYAFKMRLQYTRTWKTCRWKQFLEKMHYIDCPKIH